MKKIITDQNFLRQVSDPVESPKEARQILSKLEKELVKYPNGIGLAAIQIGIQKRVGLIRYNNKLIEIVNPTLTDYREEFIHHGEGCLSIPDTHLSIKRYKQITINNWVISDGPEPGTIMWVPQNQCYFIEDREDQKGGDGLATIAIQHELDHFDGKLIIDEGVKTEPITKEKKIGRNEPCPCGSGKKYKKCCLN